MPDWTALFFPSEGCSILPRDDLSKYLVLLFAILPIIAALMPHGLMLLPVAALIGLILIVRGSAPWPALSISHITGLITFYLYAALRGAWMGDPTLHATPALTSSLTLLSGIALGMMVMMTGTDTHRAAYRVFGCAIAGALVLYCLVLLLELMLEAFGRGPLLSGDVRKMSANVLCVWSAGFATHHLGNGQRLQALALGLGAALIAALSHSLAAGCAILAMLAMLWLSSHSPLTALRLVLGGYATLLLTAPWAMQALARLFLDSSLTGIRPGSLEARAYIWLKLADAIPGSWLIGHGVNSVRFIALSLPQETGLTMSSFNHGHNLPLTLWHDTGIIGIVLLLAILWLLYKMLRTLDGTMLRVAVTLLTGSMFISLVEYSPWFEWIAGFWGVNVLTVCLFRQLEIPQSSLTPNP